MGGESAGGGIVIALAAVLWLVYLMPTWMRRRQYLATERNAVRLQQTLRVLAETAEAPSEVRAEANARSIAEQHRALRQAAQQAEAVARAREAAAARALDRGSRARRSPKQKAAAVSELAGSRLRRGRLLASVLLLASGAGAVFGVAEVLAGGTWLYVVAATVGAFGSLAALQRIATVAAARRASSAVDRTITVAPAVHSFVDWQRSEPERPTWTPVPLPKPLYLSRREATDETPEVARPVARVTVDESLKIAAAKAEEALRAAQFSPEVTVLPTRPADGWAAMGSLDDATPGIIDLNDVLRRRRAV
ncbi:MAG: rane protein [Naasia sp.]|nr:rane protein [Naasia sp.]